MMLRSSRPDASGVLHVRSGDGGPHQAAESWATTRAATQRCGTCGDAPTSRAVAATTGSRCTGLKGKRKKRSSLTTMAKTANRTMVDADQRWSAPRSFGRPTSSTMPARTPISATFFTAHRPRWTPKPTNSSSLSMKPKVGRRRATAG